MFIVRPEDQARHGDGPQQVVEVGLRRRRPAWCRAWRGSSGRSLPGCGRTARAGRAIASSASIRSSRVSPMPIRMPVVNGTCSSPASRDRLQPHRRLLVGRAVVHAALSRTAARWSLSSMMPWLARDLAQRRDLLARHDAGIGVRQQAGLAQHQRAHRGEIGDRRLVAERVERLARRAVAQLGLVAEREQRLVAAGRLAGAGDRQAPRRATDRPAGRRAASRRRCSSGRRRGTAGSAG